METKKYNQKTIWLFLSLSLFLFSAALLSLFDFSKLSPLKANKFDCQSLLQEQTDKEKLIKWMIFLKKEESDIHSCLGDYFKSQADYLKTAEHYQKSIQANFLIGYKTYLNLLEVYDKLNEQADKELLLNFLSKKIIKPEEFPLSLNKILAKNAYLIGEKYLKNGEEKKAVYWWSEAARVLPEWSYFHLELASLYYQFGEKEKAKEVLESCLNYFYPKEHCQLYQNNLKDLEEPGFWKEEILKIEEPKIN